MDDRLRGKFRIAALLTGGTLCAEIIGGILTNSLALLSDALHVLADMSALLLSWGALYLTSRPATDTRTFGWHRAEVLSSLANGLILLVFGVLILSRAVGRILHPQEVAAIGMTLIGGIGLLANIIVAVLIWSDAQRDMNVRGVYLHAMSDALSSVGVILGGIGIMYTGWFMLDPLVGMGITVAILIGAVRLIVDASHILLEGVPRDININDVASSLLTVEGVNGVHDLHIWGLCSHIHSLSAHISVDEKSRGRLVNIQEEVEQRLKSTFNIYHTTLQMDCSSCSAINPAGPTSFDRG